MRWDRGRDWISFAERLARIPAVMSETMSRGSVLPGRQMQGSKGSGQKEWVLSTGFISGCGLSRFQVAYGFQDLDRSRDRQGVYGVVLGHFESPSTRVFMAARPEHWYFLLSRHFS